MLEALPCEETESMFSQREKTTSLVKKTPTAFPKWKAAHKWDNPFEPPTGNNGEDPLDPLADLILPRGNLEMKIHPWTLSSIIISQFHAKRSYALNLGMRFRHSHSWATTSATSWSVRALFE